MTDIERRIIELACAFTQANDDGDAASDALEDLPEDQHDFETAGLMQASEAADEDYNRTKAELFKLCRQHQGRERTTRVRGWEVDAAVPAGRLVQVGWACKDDLATLLQEGTAPVYQERQEFTLLPEQTQYRVFVERATDGVPAACVCDNGHRPTNSDCPVNASGPTFGVKGLGDAQQ